MGKVACCICEGIIDTEQEPWEIASYFGFVKHPSCPDPYQMHVTIRQILNLVENNASDLSEQILMLLKGMRDIYKNRKCASCNKEITFVDYFSKSNSSRKDALNDFKNKSVITCGEECQQKVDDQIKKGTFKWHW